MGQIVAAPVPGLGLKTKPVTFLSILADVTIRISLVGLSMTSLLCLIFFPWSADAPLTNVEQADLQQYYLTAYTKQGAAEADENSAYVQYGKQAAEHVGVTEHIRHFARQYHLQDRRVLDVGAGRGYLQDIVNDYAGLDISPSAKRFFHKRFILGSATLMPVSTDEFDAAWTIWVLEHVPNPEAALMEMRRVVKDGGLLYLSPSWDCTPFAANGYPVRPYRDFGWNGQLIKASIPLDEYFWGISKTPIHALRYASWKLSGGPTRLRYRRLTPNYQQYWMADGDAVNSLDRDEFIMWFLSRGDECLNCNHEFQGWAFTREPVILRIHKNAATRQARQNR